MKPRIILVSLVLFVLMTFAGGCSDEESPAGPPPQAPTTGINLILPSGASSGIEIVISGSSFGNSQGSGGVQVAGTDAPVVSWSDTEIKCTMPAGLSESLGASVTVTTDSGKSATYQIDITPPNTYRVTTPSTWDHQPCWSPGDDWIYFSSTRIDKNWNIWRIPAIGGLAERVFSDPEPDFYPDINPSSGELAWSSQYTFSGKNPERDYEIFRGFLPCGGPGTVCTTAMETSNVSRDLDPAWAGTVSGGYYMAYTWEEVDQEGHFVAWWIMLGTAGPPVQLTVGRQPNFSSDGRWVVYNNDDNIYKIRTDGSGGPVQLTATNHDWTPHWGWTNDKIVFQRFDISSANAEDILVMNSDGTDVQPLVATYANEYNPSWSHDGTKVVYYALVSGSFDIYVYVVP